MCCRGPKHVAKTMGTCLRDSDHAPRNTRNTPQGPRTGVFRIQALHKPENITQGLKSMALNPGKRSAGTSKEVAEIPGISFENYQKHYADPRHTLRVPINTLRDHENTLRRFPESSASYLEHVAEQLQFSAEAS